MRRLAFALPLALAALAPESAEACSAPSCWAGAFVPGDGATLPANVPGFLWRPMTDYQSPGGGDPANVTLVDTAAPAVQIVLTATPIAGGLYVLAPTQPLVAGKTYKLVDATACTSFPMAPLETTFTTVAAAPMPASLGVTSATDTGIGSLSVATASGTCSAQVLADRVDIGLALSADAMPWRDLLVYTTSLDGAPWSPSGAINFQHAPGGSWTGRGTDRVYRVCDNSMDPSTSLGADAGAHAVLLRATLPNTPLDLAATPASFTLSCDPDPMDPTDPDPSGDDGGCSVTSTAGAWWLGLALAISLRRRRRV